MTIANFPRTCPDCRIRVEPGEQIRLSESGWVHATCPEPAPPPPSKATEEGLNPLPTRICTGCGLPGHEADACTRPPPADAAARAAELRTLMGWADDGEPFGLTRFGERFGYPPRTDGQLRAMAREQVEQSRAGRLVTVRGDDGYEIRQPREQDRGDDAGAPPGG